MSTLLCSGTKLETLAYCFAGLKVWYYTQHGSSSKLGQAKRVYQAQVQLAHENKIKDNIAKGRKL